jgi:thiamine pyrophosphate-dependent acetolactate synthase large subunit-like protein
MPNGAQALMKTLADAGIEVCFTNPGTSEMHFVAALDDEPRMRAVLALFEGVATGAADGYARMADKPAATLLHLGCGLGNGLANLHNARKGKVPIVNIVGDHATYHVAARCPAAVRYRNRRAQCLAGVRAHLQDRRPVPRRGRRHCRGDRPPGRSPP